MALNLSQFFVVSNFKVQSVDSISNEQVASLESAKVIAGKFKPQACLTFKDGSKWIMTLGRDTLANAEVGDDLKKETIKVSHLVKADGSTCDRLDAEVVMA